jgi:hypothetical protein
MTWNHRIIAQRDPLTKEEWFAVHECYYARVNAKIPHSWSANAVPAVGENLDEVKKSLKRMLAACNKPVLRARGKKLVPYGK